MDFDTYLSELIRLMEWSNEEKSDSLNASIMDVLFQAFQRVHHHDSNKFERAAVKKLMDVIQERSMQ